MKAPTRTTGKKPAGKKKSANGGGGVSVEQVTEVITASAETVKAYVDLKTQTEITKRVQIEGQKEIILGEQRLEQARLEHDERVYEIDSAAEERRRNHEHAMAKLSLEERKLDTSASLQDRVMTQLEAKEISAEEATRMLLGLQE